MDHRRNQTSSALAPSNGPPTVLWKIRAGPGLSSGRQKQAIETGRGSGEEDPASPGPTGACPIMSALVHPNSLLIHGR